MRSVLFLLLTWGYFIHGNSETLHEWAEQMGQNQKSMKDWAQELGNKLGPGYSFREVERNGRTCICSTTTLQPTQTTAKTMAPSTSAAPETTEEVETSVKVSPSSTEATVSQGIAPTAASGAAFRFAGHAYKCDDNVVPVANDRNAATKYSFSTPLYPEQYPDNICCTWRIIYPEVWKREKMSRIITYTYSPDSFLPLDCTTDFITIYNIDAEGKLVEREEKCGSIGGQLGIIKHDGTERGAAFRVCKDDARAIEDVERESTGKVAISFTVLAF